MEFASCKKTSPRDTLGLTRNETGATGTAGRFVLNEVGIRCWLWWSWIPERDRNILLRWRQNERNGFSNHQPHDCLPNFLFRHRSKKTQKFRVTGLCEGNPSVIGEFPAQRDGNAENGSIWWRHRVNIMRRYYIEMDDTVSVRRRYGPDDTVSNRVFQNTDF